MLLRSKRFALLIGALICALVVASITVWRSDEPRGDRHSLTYWVNRYAEERPDSEARLALSRIGTNAIPYLLAWLKYDPPPGGSPPLSLQQRQWLRRNVGIDLDSLFRDKELKRANNAAVAFGALGSDSFQAVPGLRELLQVTNTRPASRAARALSEIPGSGVQELVLNISHRDPRVRGRCAYNLRFAGTNDLRVAPALTQALSDDDFIVRFHASQSLRKLKVDPGFVVPVHTANLRHQDPGHRAGAAYELARYGTNARSATSALISALADGDTNVQAQAREALEFIAPEALTNSTPR